jgi:hypothetical protein
MNPSCTRIGQQSGGRYTSSDRLRERTGGRSFGIAVANDGVDRPESQPRSGVACGGGW